MQSLCFTFNKSNYELEWLFNLQQDEFFKSLVVFSNSVYKKLFLYNHKYILRKEFELGVDPLCCAQLFQLCPTLCDPIDCSPPGSSVPEIFPARILGWVAMPSSRGSSLPRDWTWISWVAGGLFTAETLGNPLHLLSSGSAVPYFVSQPVFSSKIVTCISEELNLHIRIHQMEVSPGQKSKPVSLHLLQKALVKKS